VIEGVLRELYRMQREAARDIRACLAHCRGYTQQWRREQREALERGQE
jgi:hypothetical protein